MSEGGASEQSWELRSRWGAGVSAANSAPQLSPSWLRASTAKFRGLQGGSWGPGAGFRIRVSSGAKRNVVGTWGEASQNPSCTFGGGRWGGDGSTEENGVHQRKGGSPKKKHLSRSHPGPSHRRFPANLSPWTLLLGSHRSPH